MEQPKTKQRVYLLLTGLAAIACIAFIWGNSLLPAAQSAQASRSVLDLLDPILDQLHIPKGDAHRVIRKLAHMSEFALLGLLWSSLLIQLRRRSLSDCLFGAGTLALLTALVDETIQLFSPGRGSQVTDVWIDFCGACLGILAAHILRHISHRIHRKVCCKFSSSGK